MTAIVFPSSTSRDLPEYRTAVLDACRALNFAVATMEDFPATGQGATAGSLAHLERCHVYVGVFAQRYGYVEPGHPCSVTEAEYDHANKHGLECLCFFLADGVSWPEERIEHAALPRLLALKQRIQGERIVRWFRNPDDLKYEAFRALLDWLERTGRRPRGPWQVPPPPSDFVGRGDDLAALLQGFERGAAIVGARGLGGVGKTTLALVLAQRLASRFPDGQLYLDLRGVSAQPLSWRDAMGHVIRSHRPEERLPEADEALRGLYQTVLRGRRALLLMDNAADARQVEPLLPPDGCALLVTSRRRLVLPALLARDLDALPAGDAAALLRAIAPRVDGSADVIAALCGCLPLALRLAGSLLAERDDLPVGKYVERLRAARLSERSGLAEVAAALRLSEQMLPEPLRTRWRELAVLVEGFETGWAGAVWGVDGDTADDWLGTLRRNSLVEWLEATQFYRLHDLVREHALAELASGERAEAQRRHAAHFRAVLAEVEDLYLKGGEGVVTAVELFDLAWLNAEAAQAWAKQQTEDAAAQRLCVAFPDAAAYLLSLRRHPRERIAWLEAAVQAARTLGDRESEGNAVGNLGSAYGDLGQLQRAIDFHEQALAIAREIGDRRGEGGDLGHLGSAYGDLGQPQRAIDFHEQQLAIAQEIGDRGGEASACWNLGCQFVNLGRLAEAIPLMEARIRFLQDIGHPDAEKDTAYVTELRQRVDAPSPETPP